ncbi:hypothetical protein EDB84DRAFT_1563882 [Lactarius hengduanensis]|nr:hypothetical protein EDB84DRAFT_1563882 [Lactarius hengduanensis]
MLYKHILGRLRILIYTQPPVEAACFLCQVAADMCFEDQTTPTTQGEAPGATPQLKGKHKEGINVLGIVTLHGIDMLERDSRTSRLDSMPTYRLSTIRFTWSDVKLWTEFDRILQLDADTNGVARAHRVSSPVCAWADAWGVYEDACLICARRSDNSNGGSGSRDQWGSPRERSGRRRAHVRAYGDGIEGRRSSYRPQDDDDVGKYGSGSSGGEDEDGAVLVCSWQTRFLLSRLATVLPSTASSLPDAQPTPRDLLALALGPLSSLDVRFVEWFAEEYAGGARASVRRGWRDLLAFATICDIPSAVRGVGSGKMKGHYIRTLDVVLLVLNAHDRASAAASWSRRCEVHECVSVVNHHGVWDIKMSYYEIDMNVEDGRRIKMCVPDEIGR